MKIIPKDNGLFVLCGSVPLTKVSKESSLDSLRDAALEDGNFSARLLYSIALTDRKMIQDACQIRLDSSIEFLQLIDDEDEIEFDLSDSNTSAAISIVAMSSLDHYMICDFEMAISLGETALELNPEDSDNVIEILAYSYAMVGDKSAVSDIIPFLQVKDDEKELLYAICNFKLGKEVVLSEKLKQSLKDDSSYISKKNAHLWLVLPEFRNI